MWLNFENILVNKDKITHVVFEKDENAVVTAFVFLQGVEEPLEFLSEDEVSLRSTFKD